MTQRAYQTARPEPAPAPAPSKVRSLNPDPRKTAGYTVLWAIVDLAKENRAIETKTDLIAAIELARLTYAAPRDEGEAPPVTAPPFTWEQWAVQLGLPETAAHHVQERFARLDELKVFASLTGAEARQQGIFRPRGTHPGTKHFRLRVENFGNIAVTEAPEPKVVEMPAPKTVAPGEGFRLSSGETLTVPFGVAAEQATFIFKDPNQGELVFEAPKIRANAPVFEFSVAKKATSEEQIPLEQDLQNSGPRMTDVAAAEELMIRCAKEPNRRKRWQVLLTPQKAHEIVKAMGGARNWEAYWALAWPRLDEEIAKTEPKVTAKLLLWIAEDTLKHVRGIEKAQRKRERAS